MSMQGWELINTKSVISGQGFVSNSLGGGQSSTKTDIYYIFSKEVSDEELQEVVDNSYKK